MIHVLIRKWNGTTVIADVSATERVFVFNVIQLKADFHGLIRKKPLLEYALITAATLHQEMYVHVIINIIESKNFLSTSFKMLFIYIHFHKVQYTYIQNIMQRNCGCLYLQYKFKKALS